MPEQRAGEVGHAVAAHGLQTPLWQSTSGNYQSFITGLAGGRFHALLYVRGVGFQETCGHRHTSFARASACAKDLLSRATPLRIVRYQ